MFVAESINAEVCRWQDSYNVSVMTSHHASGYLSSSAMSEVPIACNRPDRPWTITVRPGQRINLTLYNFTPLRPTYTSTSVVKSDDLEDESPRSHHGNLQLHERNHLTSLRFSSIIPLFQLQSQPSWVISNYIQTVGQVCAHPCTVFKNIETLNIKH